MHATPISPEAERGSPRYNRGVRALLVRELLLAVVLVACGGSATPAPTGPTGAKVTPAPTGGKVRASATAGGRGTSGPIAIKDIGCPSPTCVFHAGAGAYYTCTSSGSGMCFHFGPPCTPPASCMYDPADRTYKQCAKPVEGSCQQWGAACAPANKCMFDARDGYHRQCEDVSGGACKRFGALCAP